MNTITKRARVMLCICYKTQKMSVIQVYIWMCLMLALKQCKLNFDSVHNFNILALIINLLCILLLVR